MSKSFGGKNGVFFQVDKESKKIKDEEAFPISIFIQVGLFPTCSAAVGHCRQLVAIGSQFQEELKYYTSNKEAAYV